MIRRLFLLGCTSLVLMPPAFASPTEEATAKLQTAVNEVLTIARKAGSREAFINSLQPVLQKHINFDIMTRRAVGPGWKNFSPEQQKQATQLFSQLIIRTYGAKFEPGQQPEITFSPATVPAAGRVEVPTRMVYAGNRYNVSYRLEKDNSWRVTDVVIEGVSLVANYRGQLDAQFKKGGAEGVIRSLSQSLAKPQ